MKPEEVEESNEKNRKIFDGIFNAVRHNLDSLMALSEESYHFESHSHDAAKAKEETRESFQCVFVEEDAFRQIPFEF